MKTTDEKAALIEKIAKLQLKQSEDLHNLKMQFQLTYESFKPLNFIKDTFHDITSSPEIKNDLLNGAVNLASNLITGNLLFKTTDKPIKNLVGTFFKFIVRKFIVKK